MRDFCHCLQILVCFSIPLTPSLKKIKTVHPSTYRIYLVSFLIENSDMPVDIPHFRASLATPLIGNETESGESSGRCDALFLENRY